MNNNDNMRNKKCEMWKWRSMTLILIALFTIGAPTIVYAQSSIQFTPNVQLPGFGQQTIGPQSLGNYLRVIYVNAVRIGTFVAFVMMVWGGFLYLVSGGFASQTEEAKSIMGRAVFGLVLLFTAYILLNTIDPNLLKLGPINIPKINLQAPPIPTPTTPPSNPNAATDPAQQQRASQQATNDMDKSGACVTNMGQTSEQCVTGKTRQECQAMNGTFLSGVTCDNYGNKNKPIQGICVYTDAGGTKCIDVTLNAPLPAQTEQYQQNLHTCQQPGAQFFPNQTCDSPQFKQILCVKTANEGKLIQCSPTLLNTCNQQGGSVIQTFSTCEAFCAQYSPSSVTHCS